MENYYEGDLNDIVRAATATTSSSPSSSSSSSSDPNPIINFSNLFFGDPFHHDQLLNNILPAPSNFSYFNYATNNSAETFITTTTNPTNNSSVLEHKIINLPEYMRRPSHNMIQISPNAKLPASPGDSPAPAPASKLPDTFEDSGLQISSSWNPGYKRSEKKKEVKKVVCIPAPAAANSRTSGEVVPSDLWAWRKYGQKPIKGSPYPRGYYRCSSSKGCSARKQVERSRTDPNMLVITYNSEHNHPWPTQRNALAGCVRSHSHHTSKTNNNNNNSETTTATKQIDLKQRKSTFVAENCVSKRSSASTLKLKQDMMIEKNDKMDGGDHLFAELGELIEAHHHHHHPLNLLFSQGFDNHAVYLHNDDQHTETRVLNDPFHDDLLNSLS